MGSVHSQKYCGPDFPGWVLLSSRDSKIWHRLRLEGIRAQQNISWSLGAGDVGLWDDVWFGVVPLYLMLFDFVSYDHSHIRSFMCDDAWHVDRVHPFVSVMVYLVSLRLPFWARRFCGMRGIPCTGIWPPMISFPYLLLERVSDIELLIGLFMSILGVIVWRLPYLSFCEGFSITASLLMRSWCLEVFLLFLVVFVVLPLVLSLFPIYSLRGILCNSFR